MFKKFFIICSGADRNLIEACSNGEQNKFAGIGATVFFTAVMAFIAGSYALYTVFDSVYYAVFFGIIWGLLIFNLDRFIVSTIKKKDHFRSELIQVTPRIILAIIIAIVISKPLEIKIFQKEIDTVLLTEKNNLTLANKKQISNYFFSDIEKNTAEIKALKQEIITKEQEVNTLYETYIAEAEGTKGTLRLGKGPVFKEKIEKHNAALKELDILRKKNLITIEEKEKTAIALQNDLSKKIEDSQPVINNFDGLMARINALDKLPWLPSLFITLLFLVIETSPIVAKLLSPRGEYDLKLEEEENILKSNLQQNHHQRELIRTTDASISNKVFEDINTDKELYNYKKRKVTEIFTLQSDRFIEPYRNQKNNENK